MATVPRHLLPMAASWTTASRGVVLAYPSRSTGAKPYLLQTSNGGKTWKSLPAPPVKFPADNDEPDVVWSGGVIAVTDGTHIEASTDSGRRWATEKIPGVSGSSFVQRVAIANGRLFAMVTTRSKTAVYSGAAPSGRLSAVRGLSISGSGSYGDISTVGSLQVDLGNNYMAQKYWYSRNGTSFISAPLPCPVKFFAILGGVRSGRPVALCSDSPSSVGPGQTDVRLRIAGRLGGAFRTSGPAIDVPNPEDFAAASAKAMTFATEGNLGVTANAGKTWTVKLSQPNGAFWYDLAFPSTTTGFVVCSTVNNKLKIVNTVYRTTNSGQSWTALSLP